MNHQVSHFHISEHMQDFIQHIKHLFHCLLPPFTIWSDVIEALVDSDVICQVRW